MIPSSLILDFTAIQAEVARFLGYGSNSANWSAAKLDLIRTIIDSGCRQAYCPLVPGEGKTHHWSFMRPYLRMTTVADQGDYDLPAGVAHVEDPITFNSTTPVGSIRVTSEHQIRLKRNMDGSTGIPEMAAVVFRKHDEIGTQVAQLMLWRTPAAAYELEFQCAIVPQQLNAANPIPMGGMSFGEVIMESCLAKAEERISDTAAIHTKAFTERLLAAIYEDRKVTSPAIIGYNLDPGMCPSNTGRGRREDDQTHIVQYVPS